MMRNRKLLIPLGVIFIIAALISLGIFTLDKKPSPEMQNLRRVEAELKLPTTTKRIRSEDDKGCHRSPMNAIQYSEYINIFYAEIDAIRQATQSIEAAGWKITDKRTDTYENIQEESTWYANVAYPNVQLYVNIEENSKNNTYPYALIISDTNSDKCRN